jgi:hypothetical protein
MFEILAVIAVILVLGIAVVLILAARKPDTFSVRREIDFFKPFEGHNTAEFTMQPQGEATHVNWLMHGPCSFMGKIMHVFFNMDAMIGKDFDAGLSSLKRITES